MIKHKGAILSDPVLKQKYHEAMTWHRMMQRIDPGSSVAMKVQSLADVMQQALWNMDLCLHLEDPDDCPDCRH